MCPCVLSYCITSKKPFPWPSVSLSSCHTADDDGAISGPLCRRPVVLTRAGDIVWVQNPIPLVHNFRRQRRERESAPLSHKRSLCDFCDHSCNYYRDEVLPCIIVHVDRMGDRPVCHSIVTAASTFWWQQSHVERRGGPFVSCAKPCGNCLSGVTQVIVCAGRHRPRLRWGFGRSHHVVCAPSVSWQRTDCDKE